MDKGETNPEYDKEKKYICKFTLFKECFTTIIP